MSIETTAAVYDRQKSLPLITPPSVCVVGCGGVGSWIALFLALSGVPELWLWDSDRVEDHNLHRLPLPADSIGKSKSEAMREVILTMRPSASIYAMSHFSHDLAEPMLTAGLQYIVATTDTHASRRLVYDWHAHYNRERRKRLRSQRGPKLLYLEAAAEGEFGSVAASPAEWTTEAETHPGYASVPVWVGPCVFAASLATAHILHGTMPMLTRLGYTDQLDGNFDFLTRNDI